MLNTWISAIHTATSLSSHQPLLRLFEVGVLFVALITCASMLRTFATFAEEHPNLFIAHILVAGLVLRYINVDGDMRLFFDSNYLWNYVPR